jgi:transcriptional regulator with XRE-family HTH domain
VMRKSLNSPAQQTLQSMLKAVRLDAGLTQQQLADKLIKPQSFVSKVEAGERLLDVIELIEFLTAIGVNPGAFVAALAQEVSASPAPDQRP